MFLIGSIVFGVCGVGGLSLCGKLPDQDPFAQAGAACIIGFPSVLCLAASLFCLVGFFQHS